MGVPMIKLLTAYRKGRLEAADLCESMVVGGRMWTEEQEIAGQALFAAAERLRTLPPPDEV